MKWLVIVLAIAVVIWLVSIAWQQIGPLLS